MKISTLKAGMLTLVELLLVTAIILFLSYKAWGTYLRKPSFDKQTTQSLSEANIDTSNAKTILDSTSNKVKDINSQFKSQLKQAEGM